MDYQPRIVDSLLDDLFPHLAAIALDGAKAVGKTATASRRAADRLTLSEPAAYEAVASNVDVILSAPPPLLIDEWQRVPAVWDRVRRAVDDDSTGGRFLLAGSATPPPGAGIHTGAGRIVSLTMRPMAFSERGVSDPTVSLAALASGGRPDVGGRTDLDVFGYTQEVLRSGFPGIRDLPERARNLQLDSYLARIVDRELVDNGMAVRRPTALRSWLAAYAAATATDAGYGAILDAATSGEANKPARQTVAQYRDHLARIFVLDPVEPWLPAFSPLSRLTRTPKHHLVDPALAARLVGVGSGALLRGDGRRIDPRTGTWLGALFESLVTQTVRVYATVLDATVGHLRTKNTHHEIDLIVETPDHRVVAIEVKLADHVTDADVTHLNWLEAELGDRVADRIVVHTGPQAYRRADGVAVIPLALLAP